MKSLLFALALAALVPALPAAAVVLKQGDVLYMFNLSLVRFDPVTGIRQVISGCADENPPENYLCYVSGNTLGPLIGTGPMWQDGEFAPPLAQPDGTILVINLENGIPYDGTAVAFRVDPANGNRTIIARASDGKGFPLRADVPYAVVPSFSPQLAALPAWGVPALLGIFVGVVLRRKPRES